MFRYFLLLILITSCTTTHIKREIIYQNGQRVYSEEDVKYISGKAAVDRDSKEPITGILKKYHRAGKISEEIEFKNGVIDGIAKGFYENGNLEYIMSGYYHGSYDTVIRYYEDGVMKSKANHRKNELHGKLLLYYENSQLQGDFNYVEGKEDGDFKVYYRHGELYSNGTFKNGKLNGTTTYYREDGEMCLNAHYEKDKLISITRVDGTHLNKEEVKEWREDNWSYCHIMSKKKNNCNVKNK
ncbi:toxin-antitoxin system YwqK family antitoxin [Fluviispira multicolorata]|uniref:toxin-antitoxin system YwqK family antitoxin n=1 Tax=Fluviispira multicolorata TaxID=2654512 RepID=UPI0013757F3F|nr:toxin-antitoxin system YwqK family antitoxin [Fluviispira multicolorata]